MAVGWHHPTVEIDKRGIKKKKGEVKSESSIVQRSTVGNGGKKSKQRSQFLEKLEKWVKTWVLDKNGHEIRFGNQDKRGTSDGIGPRNQRWRMAPQDLRKCDRTSKF